MVIMVGQIPTAKNSLCMLSLNIGLQFCVPGCFTVFSYGAQFFLFFKTAGFFPKERSFPVLRSVFIFVLFQKEPGAFEAR